MKKHFLAIGLMSGTSLDGIDAAIIKTDGKSVSEFGAWLTVPYENVFRDSMRALMRGEKVDVPALEFQLTRKHAEAVEALLKVACLHAHEVDVIGFHGQTIVHRPKERITWQIGNGAQLAAETGIDVVCDFRRMDVALGGQGAPLVPVFHAALAKELPKPVAILNIGGVANVTYVGAKSTDVLAFDTGPGNALLNDFVHAKTGLDCDRDGALARSGKADAKLLEALLRHPYFDLPPPKSLDRNQFDASSVYGLSTPDGAATLTQFTARSVAKALKHFPKKPAAWYVCGGGRHNPTLMSALCDLLGEVHDGDMLGWQGDALEAQAFAFLAVLSLKGLPLSLPGTTGVPRPTTGGAFYRAQ